MAPRDIILVTIDTLRADAPGFAGDTKVETPILDRLAHAGRVFSDAHAHSVITLPSHTNILTGLYPFQHGVRENTGFALRGDVPTLATMLHDAGFTTGAFVGAFPLDHRFGLARGFDVYDDHYRRGSEGTTSWIAERRGDEVVTAALAWWNAQAGKRRFLWVHLYDPHAPYDPPPPFKERYRNNEYLGEVAATDSFLAPLLGPHLDGHEPPALIVVTADHGESLGEHGEETHGLFAYEATLKIPLVVFGPGVQTGIDTRPARHIDIVPTVLATLGLQPPHRLPGRSLLEPPLPPQTVDSYFEALSTCLNRGWAPLRGMLRGEDKFIDLPLPELYDLGRDPGERDNLVDARAALATTLRTALPAQSQWPPNRDSAPTGEEAAKLRSLGYAVGTVAPRTSYGPDDDPKRLVGLDGIMQTMMDSYARRDYPRTVELARQVIVARPQMPDGYDQLALALRQLERGPEAIAALRQGLAQVGRNETLARQLGLALLEDGKPAEALAALTPFADTADTATLRALGVAYSETGDEGKARAALERAFKVDDHDPELIEALGDVELRAGRLPEARRELERAIALNDRLATAWNSLGVVRYRLEGAGPAIAAWQRATELDPHQYDALFNLGLVAAEAGQRDVARQAFERFLRTAPPERFAPDLAKVRAMLGQLDQPGQ